MRYCQVDRPPDLLGYALPIEMDKKEAREIIKAELELFRTKPYSELIQMIDAEPVTGERNCPSGKWYQIEIQAFWDDKSGGNVRVLGSIDDGGWRAFFPLCDDFIKSPSDGFVGE
jgi:hypothetical protein